MRQPPTAFRKACFEKGYTAKYVADQCGLHKSTVDAYFQGRRVPSTKTMLLMKEKLELDNVAELFGL